LQQFETIVNDSLTNDATQGLEPRIIIRTDSMYVINTMTTWLQKRVRENWTCLNGDLFRILHALQELYEVEYEHVRGHSGDPGNTRADALAVAACG
jgi:ribonuclease HI